MKTFYTGYSGGKHASGKLHDAYFNYRTKLAKNNLIQRRPKSKPKPANKIDNVLNLDESMLKYSYIYTTIKHGPLNIHS